MEFIDVFDVKELPQPMKGYRYLDFLGGQKCRRCFLVPYDYPRCDFFMEYSDLLDECLQPIYNNRGIYVRQDASFAVPGLYILSYSKQYSSFDKLDDILHFRTFYIIKQIRRGMRECLGINYIHMYYEEKKEKSCNVHYWLLPIYQKDTPIIFNLELTKYLKSFNYKTERKKIVDFNNKMKKYLADIELKNFDDKIIERLQGEWM